MGNKRVLWVNPSFLDYRIPLYKELNRIFDGNFHLIYSHSRIPERCHLKIKEVLGHNAHPLISEKIFHFGSSSDFSNKSINIPFPKGLTKLIKSIKPDVILAEGFFQFTPWAVKYSYKHNIPLMIAYERTAHTERNCPPWRLQYRKFINRFVSGYIANGILTSEYLQESLNIDVNRIFTGGMCADSDALAKRCSSVNAFEKTHLKKSLCLNSGLTYIFVGRLIERKGIGYLIDAWKVHSTKFPNDNLVIVGSGDIENVLKKKAENLSSVRFSGLVDYNNIHKYYAISNVFVIPTLEDNWSLVVPEAMACGLPIACSIYNGCHPELVHEGENGITFDPLNLNSTISALEYFHICDLTINGKNSQSIEREFSPQKTADKIKSAINLMLDQNL